MDTYNIDVFINQGDFSIFSSIGLEKRPNVLYILGYHFQPGWDENFMTMRTLRYGVKHDDPKGRIKDIIKIAGYPVYRQKYLKRLKRDFYNSYYFADKTCLLAKGYIQEYVNYSGVTDDSKFAVVPNALSYPENVYDVTDYDSKEKKVLIVARMDEPQKKIARALRIWKLIKEYDESAGWSLDIVGEGNDLDYYKSIVRNEEIPNVTFYGRQIPDDYYRRSSIFLMTSKSEGWGLTLTEAQQFAVVPIVFNTCAVFEEIIDNGNNGILINPDSDQGYVEAVLMLMSDERQRKFLAENAYLSCQRFSQYNVIKQWVDMIERISYTKCRR